VRRREGGREARDYGGRDYAGGGGRLLLSIITELGEETFITELGEGPKAGLVVVRCFIEAALEYS